MENANPTDVGSRVLAPILLVDDDADDRYFGTNLIHHTGTQHPVFTFKEGGAVVDYLLREWSIHPQARADLPRLMFIDLKTPGMNGFGFLEWRATHSQFRHLAVVILSDSDEPGDIVRAKRLGAKRYLMKHPGISTFAQIVFSAYGEDALWGLAREHSDEAFYEPPMPRASATPFGRS